MQRDLLTSPQEAAQLTVRPTRLRTTIPARRGTSSRASAEAGRGCGSPRVEHQQGPGALPVQSEHRAGRRGRRIARSSRSSIPRWRASPPCGHDPADGKTYIVNGHNRLGAWPSAPERRTSPRALPEGPRNAPQARMKGALINIAEGRGESTDAAKVFRDSGLDEEGLKKEGESPD